VTRDDVAAVVKSMVVDLGQHPWDINNGDCEAFAGDLIGRLEQRDLEAQELGTPSDELSSHIWVYVPSLKMHFDAETPYGEDCFLKLAVFLRHLAEDNRHPGPWTAGNLELLGETKLANHLLAERARWWEKGLKGHFKLTEDLGLSCGGRDVPAGRYKVLYVVASIGNVVIEGDAGSFNIPSHDLAWALEIGTAKKIKR